MCLITTPYYKKKKKAISSGSECRCFIKREGCDAIVTPKIYF